MSISDAEQTPVPISLSKALFKIVLRDSFRFYGWGGSSANGTFSINEFAWVVTATLAPTIKQ
jgi:hypothetical protein